MSGAPPRLRTHSIELLTTGAALVLFVWLAVEVRLGRTQALDDRIRSLVHACATPALTTLMRGLSLIGEPAVLIVLSAVIIAWYARRGRLRAALPFLLTLVAAEGLDQLLKLMLHRPRPAAFFGLAEPAGYSFPSGHALVSCTFFGMLAAMAAARTGSRTRRLLYNAAAAVPIAAIGYSRVYLGVHYPSDVLAGYAAGAAIVVVGRSAQADD